ncbi:acyl-protein thioesterase [Talaromyces pinophilus]|uniref:Acyl-protein thioesterase n=1 Tax=Talaromyces pinophilus TaxID=128442 RepID=A0A6V8HJX8_TALPI|nr:acyl-protein thioesterase [Talaromyces pinophilus]
MPPRRPPRWPRPLVINPQASPHKQTFIILHDRGSNATDFGTALLFRPFHRSRNASNTQYYTAQSMITLHTAFPHAKFVFPTASMLRAATFTESVINQWFDTHWPLTEDNEHNARNSLDEETRQWRSELPIPGLRDAVRYIHDLITAEIEDLDGDAGSVIIGGFSQGSAASLVSALLWEAAPLGGWFGLSGWLPFAEEVVDAAQEADEEDEASTPLEKGIDLLREKLDIQASSQTDNAEQGPLNIPLFIAHGTEDKTVPITLGRQMVDSLKSLGWGNHNMQSQEYRGLAHTYSEDMLSDMVEFLTERLV